LRGGRMTIEELKKRMEELITQGKQHEVSLHMINGAIEDIKYWMEKLNALSPQQE